MQVWIDNTGLHGAGRCLAGTAKLDQELRGFLQLATLLVFSDSITYGDYGVEALRGNSESYRRSFISLGVDPECLLERPISEADYASICEKAAAIAAEEWAAHFERIISEGLSVSFEVPTGIRAGENWIPDFVLSDTALPQSKARAFLSPSRATGAVEYMLSVSPTLRDAVAGTLARCSWDAEKTYQFLSFVRAILNDQLAKQQQSTYVPAVSRAEQLARESSVIAAQVDQHLKETMGHWKPGSFSIPRVSLTLLRRAKGDPGGIVSEALRMREQAARPRKYLSARLTELNRNPLAPGDEAEKIEFERQAAAVLGLEAEPRLVDAIELHFVVGLPSVSLSAGKLYDWALHSVWRRRLIVLTDLARSTRLTPDDEPYLRSFVEKATGRSFGRR